MSSFLSRLVLPKKYVTVFPDYFKNPVFRKQEQQELIERGELSKMAMLPVKPPQPSQSSSSYYDDLVE